MEENKDQNSENEQITESAAQQDRREVIQKLGKFAAYAAPFTILAFSAKGATSSGPGKHAVASPAAH